MAAFPQHHGYGRVQDALAVQLGVAPGTPAADRDPGGFPGRAARPGSAGHVTSCPDEKFLLTYPGDVAADSSVSAYRTARAVALAVGELLPSLRGPPAAGLTAWAAADRRSVLRASARCVRAVPGSGVRTGGRVPCRRRGRRCAGVPCPPGSAPRSMSAGPRGWPAGAQAGGLEAICRPAGAAHGDRNRPGDVVDPAQRCRVDDEHGVQAREPTPHSSCSRASIAPHRIVSTSPGHRRQTD